MRKTISLLLKSLQDFNSGIFSLARDNSLLKSFQDLKKEDFWFQLAFVFDSFL